MSGTTTLRVTLSPALQAELDQSGVWADAVWFDSTTTAAAVDQWTTLVNNGTIESLGTGVSTGTFDIPLPNPMDGGKVYFIIQSGPSSASDPIRSEITSQSDINWNNAGTHDFGYDSFEVSLKGKSGDAGNLSSVNAFALPMEVSVPYNNGTTATVGYGISGNQIVDQIGSIVQNGSTVGTAVVQDFTAGPLTGHFRTAIAPAGANNAAPFPGSVWLDYINSIESIVPNITSHALSPIVLSGEFNGAASVDDITNSGSTVEKVKVWHNGGYFAYQLEWDSTNNAFALVPLPQSQIQGTIEITQTALAADIYSPGLASATIYSNGTIYQPDIPIYSTIGTYSPDAPMNTGANNQWGKVLSDFFTGFTGGFYEQGGKPLNPQLTGTIDLNQNLNWDPGYAFGNDVIQQSATYQTSDPWSKIFYQNSNSYGSAYSDNLMSQYAVGGPLISMNNPGSASDVGTIDLTIFANSDTPSPNTSQGYTPPQIYNYISAAPTGYAIPNFSTTDFVTLNFAASVANNAGVVLASTDTVTLNVLNSDTNGQPSWDTITFDGSNAGTSGFGLWQYWNIIGQPGSYTATPSGTYTSAGNMVIGFGAAGFPVVQTGTAVSWYQLGIGSKTFNLYTTTINGQFENTNYPGQQGALAVDGLATIAANTDPTLQTVNAFTVNFASSSAVTVDPSLLVANTDTANVNALPHPNAPVAGTLSGATFTALQGQTAQVTNTITISAHDLAFAWTGDNSDPNTGSWISGYTNKIDAGDIARVTIESSGTTYATTDATADIDGQWNTGTVDLGNGVYTVTMQEFQPTDSLFAHPLTPTSSALVLNVTCFVAGTRIATERGEVAVEALREGDRVQLVVGSAREVVWIGRRTVDCSRHPRPKQVWPVRIAAGAFGTDRPYRDLLLSPDHAVYVGEALIPVKYLINGSSITQVPLDEVTYYHVELPQHAVLLANGLPAESYLDTGDRSNFANGDGPVALHPDFSSRVWEASGCAPLMVAGPAVDAARQLVAASASSAAGSAISCSASAAG